MSLYLVVRGIHIASVLTSFALFLFRAGLMFGNVGWRQHLVLRVLPHVVDTILLTSALFLATLIHQYPFVHAWLTVKVLVLVAYIVAGSMALKRAKTRNARITWFVFAVMCFLFIVSVARAHHPLGFLLYLR